MSPLHDIIVLRSLVDELKADVAKKDPLPAMTTRIVGSIVWGALQQYMQQIRRDGGWVSDRGERQGDRTVWRFNLRGHRDTIAMTDAELETRKRDMEDRLLKLVDRIYGNRESPRPS